MAPKRKRPERGPSDVAPPRPSPHRPGDTALGQHDRNQRGGRNPRRNDRRDSSQSFNGAPTPSGSQGPISPTLPRPSSSSSTAGPPRIATASAPAVAPPSGPPSPILSGYAYTIVTDDRVSRWTKGGSQEVVDHGIQSRQDEDLTELTAIFQELIQSVVDLRLSGSDAGAAIKNMLASDATTETDQDTPYDPPTLFLDTFQIYMELEPDVYRDELQNFMIATAISPDLMRLILDPEVLKKLGLIREAFSKMGVRYATNVLYRQANYNLVREETEGYSKLLTEMFTTSSNEPPTAETVQATFERTKGLIGAFDLDVGRVLDVLMDIFAAILIKQFKFFVKFLRISSWWPRSQITHSTSASGFVGGLPIWALPNHSSWLTTGEEDAAHVEERRKRDVIFWERARQVQMQAYFELGSRQPADAELQRLADAAAESGHAADLRQQWIATTKTLPPIGNRDAAQILGFKLRFYSSEARNNSEIDVLPANLLYLAALLVKIGFISITDLWPHLWPLDEDIDQLREAKLKEIEEKEKEKRGGTTNALMMAGALPDDMPAPPTRRDAPVAKPEAEKKAAETPENKLKPPKEQKGLLLICLLTIGAIPEALFILGRYDWILEAFADEVLPLIHRIINYSIDPLYKKSRPAGSQSDSFAAKPMPDIDQSSATKGTVKLSSPPAKRTLKWPHPDKFDTNDGNAYRFYWDEWADNVPVCQTVDDMFTLCSTFLNISGVNIGKDPSLVAKLASIGIKSMADDPSAPNIARWQDLLRRLLVPCLSLGDPNSSNVAAVWDILQQFPVQDRYNLYAEWFEGSISRLPPIKKAFARTRSDALSIMKRLSLDNLQEMARKLAKTAYSSPGVVFKVALNQIQSYSNLIQVFVECGRYFTDMGYDVLVWSVLSSLGQNRSRTQADSILYTSQWLQALSKFSGKVFQRYAVMDPAPVVQYVNNQLFKGNATDLVILRELITSMGGVVSDVDFTEAQLRAMTGGELLRRETLINLGDRREKSAKSAQHLMRALVNNQLAGQLLVNIAQYRQSAIFKVPDDNAHIKYLATLLDDTHQTFIQYLELLRSNLDTVKFDSLVPSAAELMRDYGLDVSIAFMVTRASLRSKGSAELSAPKEDPQTRALAPGADGDGDVSMGESAEIAEADNTSAKTGRKADAFLDSLHPLIQAIPSVLPAETWLQLSPDFFVLFWSLQLNDLVFPQSSYIAENNRLKKAAEEVLRQKSDAARTAVERQQEQLARQEQRKEILGRLKQLNDEQKHDLEYFGKARFALIRQANNNTWLIGGPGNANAISDALLEKCILPRIMLSFLDVEYSFRMIKFLHDCSVSNFRLMSFYDRLFNHNRLRSIIFTCSVREAEHLGHFLKCILEELTKWHGDQASYEKEALGEKEIKATKDNPSKKTRSYTGFATAFDDDGKPTAFVDHKAFKDTLLRWHKNLNTALRACLSDMEWMHIRNAITILKAVLDFFPAIDFMGNKFLEQLKEINAREAASKSGSEASQGNRVDLSVAAQTAFSQLQKRKSAWVLIQAFRPGPAGEAKSGSATPAANALRATAPEFKPGPASRARPVAEVEDGEVRDGKPRQTGITSSQPPSGSTRQPTTVRDGSRDSSISNAQKSATSAPSSNPSTPKAAPATLASAPPGRSDSTRPSTLPSRPELPRKPNVPLPSSVSVDQFGQIRNHERRDAAPLRDSREHRESPRDARDQHPRDTRGEAHGPRENRDHRPSDLPRPERPREFPGPDRRVAEPHPRESGRGSDRDRPSRPDPPRWNEHGPAPADRDSRVPRERPQPPSRDPRPPRDTKTDPSSPGPASTSQSEDPPINPERARLLGDAEMVNPARAALITDNREPPSRNPRDQVRERVARANESPRPSDNQSHGTTQADANREDRHGRGRHSDYHASGRDLQGDSATPVRGERNADRDSDRDRRDSSSFGGPSSRDDHHGRLNQQDPNYGRLSNPIPSVVSDSPSGPPSGPRGRGRNAARLNSAPNRPPSPERGPPTGPSSSRPRRGQFDGGNSISPTTAAAPPPVPSGGPGLHPDRMRHVSQSSGVHPDRLNQISGPGPYRPAVNTPERPTAAPRPTPSSAVNTPGSEVPSAHGTPTGPAGPDRMRPGGRQLRGIQSTLERASVDNTRSSKPPHGRGSRMSLANSDAQVLTGSSPVTTPVQERQDPLRSDSSRRDGNLDRAPIPSVADSRENRNGDDYNGSNRAEQDRGRREHHRSERPSRASRRSSRERSPEREREPKDVRDYRDRRDGPSAAPSSNHRDGERDPNAPRRTHREPSDHNRDRESSNHRPHRPDGPVARNDMPMMGRGDGRDSRVDNRIDGRGEGRGDHGDNYGGRRDGPPGRGGDEYGGSGRNGPPRGGGGPPRDPRPRPDDRGDRRDERGRKRRSDVDLNDRVDNKRPRG
ncbi:hypothetical protein GQ53DRAFT_379180 [Thozetella sp. PMI_491]|nr:hypothetical protein GQ53DRAFT_379180 [Thozetella sp. PMI_491]